MPSNSSLTNRCDYWKDVVFVLSVILIMLMTETTVTAARSTQTVLAFHVPRLQQCPHVRCSTSTARVTITTLPNQIQYASASCSVSLSLPSLSTLKFAKNDNTEQTNSLIWFQLMDFSNGKPYKNTRATKVSIPSTADVADFCKAVKAEYVDSYLSGVAPSDLLVYKNKAAYDAKDDPLKVSASLKGLGKDDEDNALIVVVPSLRIAQLDTDVVALQNAQLIGEAFIESIMVQQNLQVIVEQELYYMKDVVRLSGETSNIIISQNVRDFWSVCLQRTTKDYRVCASGSPGIGKSTSMLYLIWVLLKERKRVVYIMRTPDNTGFYYDWKFSTDGSITTNVYPESMFIGNIIDRKDENIDNTYFLIDPGKTDFDVSPPMNFLVKVIMNASADDRHWGGTEFKKRREDGYAYGVVLTFPMLTKDQIFQARELFRGYTDAQTLENRHRVFGNIPRFLFEKSERINDQIISQDQALAALSGHMAKRIMNNMAELNNNDKDAPRSAIMCITSEPPDFTRPIASFVSDRVKEQAAKTHIRHLWYDISSEDSNSKRGDLFEAYVRSLLCGETVLFNSRICGGKKSTGRENVTDLELGGCTQIQRSTDIIEDCKNGMDGVIFYAYSPFQPFVDIIYKVKKVFYAIQVTTAATHSCNNTQMVIFLGKLDLQVDEKLSLIYAVPDARFKEFNTNPVDPIVPTNVADLVVIRHVEIRPPSEEIRL